MVQRNVVLSQHYNNPAGCHQGAMQQGNPGASSKRSCDYRALRGVGPPSLTWMIKKSTDLPCGLLAGDQGNLFLPWSYIFLAATSYWCSWGTDCALRFIVYTRLRKYLVSIPRLLLWKKNNSALQHPWAWLNYKARVLPHVLQITNRHSSLKT